MVPFAYRLYQRYLAGEVEDFQNADSSQDGVESGGDRQPLLNGDKADECHSDTYESARNEITAFSNTFCRKEPIKRGDNLVEANVKVYFLGIWDCVNSVAVLERVPPMPVSIAGTAHFVRHAVAVDERRVKFKPALFSQDTPDPTENVEEVWFPGCHGDVGGGWPATHNLGSQNQPQSSGISKFFKRFWTSLKPTGASKDVRTDAFQMSDVALSWMIQELEYVATIDEQAGVKWSKSKDGYKKAFAQEKSQNQALRGPIHDSLVFGNCSSFFKVLFWKFLGKTISLSILLEKSNPDFTTEIFPFITRWEIEDDRWKKVWLPLNNGSYRDIPRDAKLHQSLLYRLTELQTYCPRNNHGGKLKPCLKSEDGHPTQFLKVEDQVNQETDPMHQIWTFPTH